MWTYSEMRLAGLLLGFSLSVTLQFQGTTGFATTPPVVVEPKTTELILTSGDELVIICNGADPLSWTYPVFPKVQDPKIQDRLQMENQTVGETKHGSRLRLFPTQFADTGRYTCTYSNAPSFLGIQSSVYVYIQNNTRLFAPHKTFPDPTFLTVVQGRPFEIPCRVTHPAVNVTLLKGKVNVEMNQDLTFDPRIGFTVNFPSYFYHGSFLCFGRLDETTENMTFVLFFQASKVLPPPTIIANHSNAVIGEGKITNVFIDDTLQLHCLLSVDAGQLASLSWSVMSSDRIEVSDLIKKTISSGDFIYNEFLKTVTIRSVTFSDAGQYRCDASSIANSSNYQTVNVIDDSFVYLTASEEQVEITLGSPTVLLSVDILSSTIPTLIWLQNQVPISKDNKRFKQDSRQGQRATLQILDVILEDMAEYTLRASTKHTTDTATIWLIVNEPPTVTLTSPEGNDAFFIVNGSYHLRCSSAGFPLPNLKWLWQPCLEFGCRPSGDQWQPVDNPEDFQESRKVLSTLSITANTSGFYQCFAWNKVGNDSGFMDFYVSDINGGYGMSSPAYTFVDGDNSTIECKSNKLVFHPPQLYEILSNATEQTVENSSNIKVFLTENMFSHIVVMEFYANQPNVIKHYRCRCKNYADQDFFKDSQLTVIPAEPPVFIQRPNGTAAIKVQMDYTLRCLARGQPAPSYIWFHNSNVIDERNKSDGYILLHKSTELNIRNASVSHSGVYTCEASNRVGSVYGNLTLVVSDGSPPDLAAGYIALIVISVLAIVALIVVGGLAWKRRHQTKYIAVPYDITLHPDAVAQYNPDLPIHEQVDCLAYDQAWEFPKECLKFDIVLGQGAFGKVMRAEAYGITESEDKTQVAVKMVRDIGNREQLQSLLSELKILIHVGSHLNIVNLLGAVTIELNRGALYVIVEYCRHGCLREHLIKNHSAFDATDSNTTKDGAYSTSIRNEDSGTAEYVNSPTEVKKTSTALGIKDIVCFAYQIARGMEYLASKRYIHRDLATRNVLLAEDQVVKICDFGLAKDCQKYNEYHKKSDTPIPVKWMAIESLTHKLYTTKSDVWSYGILLWELFSLGANPYPGVDIDETFVDRLKKGYRLPKPKYSSEKIYDIMRLCWETEPEMRPNFSQLVQAFDDLVESSSSQNYLLLLEESATRSNYLRMRGSSYYLPMKKNRASPTNDSLRESSYVAPPPAGGSLDYTIAAPGSPDTVSPSKTLPASSEDVKMYWNDDAIPSPSLSDDSGKGNGGNVNERQAANSGEMIPLSKKASSSGEAPPGKNYPGESRNYENNPLLTVDKDSTVGT